jgi:tyrosyl-tRNA synthetase
LCRGDEAAVAAEATARQIFEQGQAGGDLPVLEIAQDSISILDALVGIGFCTSKGEAKRLIAGGGAKIADDKITQDAFVIVLNDRDVRISAGKKKHGILRRI